MSGALCSSWARWHAARQWETLASLNPCSCSCSGRRAGPAPGVPQLRPVVGLLGRPTVSIRGLRVRVAAGHASCGCWGSSAWGVPRGCPPGTGGGPSGRQRGPARESQPQSGSSRGGSVCGECPGSWPAVSPPVVTSWGARRSQTTAPRSRSATGSGPLRSVRAAWGAAGAGPGRAWCVCRELQVQPPGGPAALRSRVQTRCLPAAPRAPTRPCYREAWWGPAVGGQVGRRAGSPGPADPLTSRLPHAPSVPWPPRHPSCPGRTPEATGRGSHRAPTPGFCPAPWPALPVREQLRGFQTPGPFPPSPTRPVSVSDRKTPFVADGGHQRRFRVHARSRRPPAQLRARLSPTCGFPTAPLRSRRRRPSRATGTGPQGAGTRTSGRDPACPPPRDSERPRTAHRAASGGVGRPPARRPCPQTLGVG